MRVPSASGAQRDWREGSRSGSRRARPGLSNGGKPVTLSAVTQTPDDLERAFSLYFEEMQKCAAVGLYFALLHIIVALPDVCAALEEPDARPSDRYESWVGRYRRQELFSPAEFWDLRCKLLHQGQAVGKERGRYRTFSFPVHPGVSIHLGAVVPEANLILDPRRMAIDMRQAIEAWFADLRQPENAARLAAVRTRLPLLVREQRKEIPGFEGPSFYVLSST